MPLHKLLPGDKIRAVQDRYPAKAGAVATVRYIRTALGYVVVEWDDPENNHTPERKTELSLKDLEHFELL
jgi:hypothetical protein